MTQLELAPNPVGSSSAYPPSVDDLMPAAHEWAVELGQVPSRNRLMERYRIGAPKATAVRERLMAGHPDFPVSPAGPIEYPFREDAGDGHPGAGGASPAAAGAPRAGRPVRSWPVVLIALPAFVSVWAGWVALGGLTGYGVIHPFPGIADHVRLNTAITLPIGVEAYAAYAIRVWLSAWVSARARRFARASVVIALGLGASAQIAYHLMAARHMTAAPWQITVLVGALPILVLFAASALAHLVRTDRPASEPA